MRRQGTPGSADWGTYDPDPAGICHSCGRDFGGHAGQGCFAPNAQGLPRPRSSQDTCPQCGAARQQLLVAVGRFYCERCQVAGPGPYAGLPETGQLTLGPGF